MNFGQHNGTSLTWTVNVTAGTSVSLKITDATGATNYDQAVTVRKSLLPFSEEQQSGLMAVQKPGRIRAASLTIPCPLTIPR